MVSISVITPTIGRESLRTMLLGLLPQLQEKDEVLIIGDGPQPNAKKIVDELNSQFIKYWETPVIRNYGNPQRNEAIAKASGDYIMFVDDDDSVYPTMIAPMRKICGDHSGKPIMFKMQAVGQILWREPKVQYANVSGQMFVFPNTPGRVGKWSGKYGADFDFMMSTLALYPEGHAAVVWRTEMITKQGWAGPGGAGGREM